MENESRIKGMFESLSNKLGDTLLEQAWFQQIKGKWEELDSESRFYVKLGAGGLATLLILIIFFSELGAVHDLRDELKAKTELLKTVQAANAEIKKLKESNASSPSAEAATGTADSAAAQSTQAYLTVIGASLGFEKNGLSVAGGEKLTPVGDLAKEALFEVSLKHVSIRQVIGYAFNLESGKRPIKLRKLAIDTQNDPLGFMNATLSISVYAMNPAPK